MFISSFSTLVGKGFSSPPRRSALVFLPQSQGRELVTPFDRSFFFRLFFFLLPAILSCEPASLSKWSCLFPTPARRFCRQCLLPEGRCCSFLGRCGQFSRLFFSLMRAGGELPGFQRNDFFFVFLSGLVGQEAFRSCVSEKFFLTKAGKFFFSVL